MGTGLSMASVNKIKELANSREYSLALELVEHQDLTRSLNPQFLRLCGEIYIKNDRYADARRCLIMAHRLGPASKRIMYVFVDLYLRMGYFELAKTYYDMYMFESDGYDGRQVEYIWKKHLCLSDGFDAETAKNELEPMIATYAHNMDYDWSFELYLLYKKEGKDREAGALGELYCATFRDSEYSRVITEIANGENLTDRYFEVYAVQPAEDTDTRQEELRAEERELLELDEIRMHPKEAEITVMYDDVFSPAESEKMVQRMLKKQDRDEQRKEKRELKKQKQEEKRRQKLERREKQEEEPDEKPEEMTPAEPEEKPVAVEEVKTAAAETEEKSAAEQETISEVTEPTAKPEDDEKKKREEALKIWLSPEDSDPSGGEPMKRTGAVTIDDGDDGFEPEAETIEELAAQEGHVSSEEHTPSKEETAHKPAYVFETVELAPEEQNDEYEADDFSDSTDDEFGEMKTYEPEEEPEPEPAVEEEPEEEPVVEEEPEEEPEPEPAVEEEPEPEPAVEEEPEPEPAVEEEPEPVVGEEPEPVVEEEPEEEPEPEPVVEEEPEEEPEPDPVVEEEPEEEPEPEPVVEEEPEPESVVEEEPEPEPVVEEEPEEEPEFHVAPFTTKPQKKKLDFPVFRSSLFPDYHNEVKEVENNFDEIMEQAQDKMSENMRKEEQMQKEAEALLASLGIRLDDVPASSGTVRKPEPPEKKGPSRDELKASLKIDSVKKDLLKKMKEYR